MKKALTFLLLAAVALLSAREMKKDDYAKRKFCGWQAPPYWAGKLSIVDDNGKKCLQLDSGVRAKTEFFGRALATNVRGIEYYPGLKIRIKIKAKGTGKLTSGVLVYQFGSGAPAYNTGGSFQLTNDFKDYEFVSTLTNRHRMVLPYFEITPKDSKVIVQSFYMDNIENANKITAVTPIQVIETGKKAAPITFTSNLKDKEIFITKQCGNKVELQKVKSDKNGKITFDPGVLPEGLWQIAASADCAAAKTFVDVQKKEAMAEADKLAKKIKLAKKTHVLFLGDSLTDFYRGENYVDRLSFWMNKYNPGKFTFRNAGIGGDFLERMETRMQGELRNKAWAWRQKDYKGIFKEKYDLIFLFLGHNDTRCWRKDNYSTQQTPPALQQKYLKSILTILQKNCPGAKLILIAPSPSDEALFLARDKKLAKGANMPMYGKKEFVNLYDTENKKFCKENGLEYIDVLSAMRKAPVLKELYVSDGVHLSPIGNRLIAATILRHLAK